LQLGDRFWSLGSRHGLVLIFDLMVLNFVVCDPVTSDQHRIAVPSRLAARARDIVINGAVFRTGGGAHFQVVLTTADNDDKHRRQALACVYSSEAGLWGDLISNRFRPRFLRVIISQNPPWFYLLNQLCLLGTLFTGFLMGILLEFLSLIWKNKV
jgi:hypothetical protein